MRKYLSLLLIAILCIILITLIIYITLNPSQNEPIKVVLKTKTIESTTIIIPTETEIENEITIEEEPIMEKEEVVYTTNDDYSATIIAKIIYGEARGVYSTTEQACIAWTILNRVDYYGGTIVEIALSPNQFAYDLSFPTIDDYGRDLFVLAKDVIGRWEAEKTGQTNIGRVLPSDYMWYAGDGQRNYYRNAYQGGDRWDYSLESPYES